MYMSLIELVCSLAIYKINTSLRYIGKIEVHIVHIHNKEHVCDTIFKHEWLIQGPHVHLARECFICCFFPLATGLEFVSTDRDSVDMKSKS